MKKLFLLITIIFGTLVIVACGTTAIEPDDNNIIATGIHLADSVGQGTKEEPFVFNMDVNDEVAAEIVVSPAAVVRNLSFTMVKKDGENFVTLDNDDVKGFSLNTDNGNDKLSFKALKEGKHYLIISQDEIKVYVLIDVNPEPDPEPIVDFNKNLKVLAIGNSFSDDTLAYLYQIADNYGVENITLGILYIGGSELAQHANNAKLGTHAYTYRKNTTGSFQSTANTSILTALEDEEWDIITLQQASHHSGNPDKYEPHLTNIIDYVEENKTNPEARIFWNMTWAYQANSTHGGFPFYDNNQMTMYNAIVDTYQSKVKPHVEVKGLIPAGTAIQNVRTSYIGDTVTQDGYHLNGSHGRYTAALSMFKSITKFSLDDITYKAPGVSAEDLDVIKEAVNNAFNKPLEVTESTFKTGANEDEVIKDHTLLKLNWIIGYYQSENAHKIYNDAGNSIFFTTHDTRLSKENLPIGSVIRLEGDNLQYRLNFFMTLEGPTTGNMRTGNFSTKEIVIDEDWWGNYEYVGINISYKGSNTDMSSTYKEDSKNLKLYAAPGAVIPPQTHIDEELSFVSGYWNDNATKVTNLGNPFDLGFAASNIISKAGLGVFNQVEVAAGYQIRVVFLSYDGEGNYKVLHRTANKTGLVLLDEELWAEYEYIAFNISTTPSSDLSGVLDDLPNKLSFGTGEPDLGPEIPHVDAPLEFNPGYYVDNGTDILYSGTSFDKGFAYSNPLSKAGLIADNFNMVTIAPDHQVRVIFLSYNGHGTYKVMLRTDNLKGEIELYKMWDDYDFIAFNISTTPSSDISEITETLASKITFSYEEPQVEIPHVDEPLVFVSGYWTEGKTAPVNTGSEFDLGFAASNAISKASLEHYTDIEIASGYKVRVIFFTYDNYGTYTAVRKTDYLAGPFVMDEAFWGNNEYLGFNIGVSPVKVDTTTILDTFPAQITFIENPTTPHVDEPLAFVSGYWDDNRTEIINQGGTFDLGFAGTNAISKAFFDQYNSFEIVSGYKVRAVFFTYDMHGTYKVVYRTEWLEAGVFPMDEAFWGEYQYLGFNIASVPSSDLSEVLSELTTKIIFDIDAPEAVPHVDEPINFVQGYWNINGTNPTTADANGPKFIASNVLSKAYFDNIESLTMEAGYQVRVIFLTYDNAGNYKVAIRTDNFTGQLLLNAELWEQYEYIAFNLSTIPLSDITQRLPEVAATISFQVVD